jgi:predicted RNA-binding protein associated with RNAse of E/G family
MSSGEVILMPNNFIDRQNHFYKKLYNFITNLKELDNFKDINFSIKLHHLEEQIIFFLDIYLVLK